MGLAAEVLPSGQRTPGHVFNILLAAGIIVLIEFTFVISTSVYIFSGPLSGYLGVGVSAMMLASAIPTLITGLFGTNPATICGARGAMIPVLAALVGGAGAMVLATGNPEQVLPTLVATVAASAVVTGILLYLLGLFRLGNMIRAIPFPVMGGFFAGVGWLFCSGGISVMAGISVSPATFAELFRAENLALWIPGMCFGFALFVIQRIRDHWLLFPLMLIVGLLGFYSILFLSGGNLESAREGGWLVRLDSREPFWPPLGWEALGSIHWGVVVAQVGAILVVFAVNAISLLLDATGIELLTKRDLSLNQDLKVSGVSNVFCGLCGGAPGVHSVGNTAFATNLGGVNRLAPLAYAFFSAVALLIGPLVVTLAPLPLLGGLLVYLGLVFLHEWIWKAFKRMPMLDYVLVLIILGCIAGIGVLEGVGLGLVTAILLFAYNYSRLSVVKFDFGGKDLDTHVDRPPAHEAILDRQGGEIHVYVLQGFLFFGSANGLIESIRERAEDKDRPPLRYLILDFRLVERIDISAAQSFEKLQMLGDQMGFSLVFTDLRETVGEMFRRMEFYGPSVGRLLHEFPELSMGGSWCEEELLKRHEAKAVERMALEKTLGEIEEAGERAGPLAGFFRRMELDAGAVLFRQGEEATDLFYIEEGRIDVFGEIGKQRRRLRTLGPGTFLGEMALYRKEKRSAGAEAVESSVVYVLEEAQWKRIREEHPEVAEVLHLFMVRLLSERLSRSNVRLLRALS